MNLRIMGMFIRLPMAQGIWDVVAHTYYDGADQSIILITKRSICTNLETLFLNFAMS